ncbi:ABC transporter ATP-binding protein [Litchfieldella qijiaojingensis]|uniref:ABC transporter ATP-binding protein n=1 Tax=Litchfieldella qijiaojingensis TaxID=980347 RepID=A0ABQ2ZB34_9GAMM|nr:ATP-binding cassette domain-containing protein [Halomonas qijiaojingensis]GGY10647.1 ABC transporter ATP-binding protein [Halomonas qijiaojingensis]
MNDMRLPPSILPLELENVSFVHRGQVLLDRISLRLEGHGKTLIMGPNGAGKSLLMRLCHGLLKPTGGRIRWSGHANGKAPRQAMVFQRPVLLRRSALANLTYALAAGGTPRSRRKLLAWEALEHFGLTAIAHRPARVLSGGEQQRLALARAWLLKPEVLFLDEPTSALDPAAIKAVEDAVADFHRQGTRIVMSSHDLNQARRLADEVVFLYGGRLIEHSPAEVFFSQPQTAQARAFIDGELVW